MTDLPNDFPTEEELEAEFAPQDQPAAAPTEEQEHGLASSAEAPEVDPEEAEAQAFVAWMKQNPDAREQLLRWSQGEQVMVPRSYVQNQQSQTQNQTQSEPIDQEPDDYYSEDYLKGLRKDITELRSDFDQRIQLEAKAAVDEGVNRFKTKHTDLEASDLTQVVQFVYDRGLLNSIPDDLSSPQKSSAVEQRFEEAYRAVFYDRSQQQATRQVVSDMNSRRRAASSSSPATSTPRVEPAPSTPEEKKAAYVDAIAQALAEDGGS